MVLESTMICFDNSDYMRNEDYIPTRFNAQKDAVIDICYSRHRRNPLNDFGFMTLSDVKVLASLTTNLGTIICRLQEIELAGRSNLHRGIKVAHMALRHRPEKHFKMRIVLFIGSPLHITTREMTNIGKTLRKENVYIDIVSFGEIEQNQEVLLALFNAVNGKDGRDCNYISIEGPDFTESLKGSMLTDGLESVASLNITAGNINEIQDPDLILALQLSLEEESRRQANERNLQNEDIFGTDIVQRTENTDSTNHTTSTPSNSQSHSSSRKRKRGSSSTSVNTDFANMTEEEQISYVIQKSMDENEPKNKKPNTGTDQTYPRRDDEDEDNQPEGS